VAAGPIITLAEVKRQLNMPTTYVDDDAELTDYIAAASEIVEQHRKEVIVLRQIVDVLSPPRPTTEVTLRSVPMHDLVSVARVDGTFTWLVSDFRVVDAALGRLKLTTGGTLMGDIRFTYNAGFTPVPANVAVATRLIVQYLWDTQRQPGVGPNPISGGGSDDYMTPTALSAGIPDRALALLGGRPPVVA
jgi:hypothetical protein